MTPTPPISPRQIVAAAVAARIDDIDAEIQRLMLERANLSGWLARQAIDQPGPVLVKIDRRRTQHTADLVAAGADVGKRFKRSKEWLAVVMG